MYSFLNDRELYGTSLSEQPIGVPQRTAQLQPSGPVAVHTMHSRSEARTAEAPTPSPEIFFKTTAMLEQRILNLEERLVVALAKFSSEMAAAAAARKSSEPVAVSFWTFTLAVMLATGLVLLFAWLCRPRWQAPASATMPQLVLQSLPAQSLPLMQAPPTPVIFTAPPTFLPGS